MTRTKSRGLYRCKECSKEFQSDFALFQHLQSRTKRCTNTACFYCGDDENSPMFRLSDHMKERHSVFECAFCREKFFLRAKFEEHMKNREGIVNAWSGDTLPGMGERESFDELIDRLNPDTVVYEECERIKEKLEWFMRHNTSYKQCHITMAGSIAKETPLSKADVDLILFLHTYSTLEEFIDSKKEIIERIKRHVENRDINWAHGLRFQRRTPYSIQFELSVSGSSTLMDVDLLPAVQLLPRNTYSERDALYTKMKSMSVMERKHCGPCLSELQVQFVRRVPDTLKQVIRIVKNWIKIVREEERCRTVRCYFCELVVIDYWLSDDSPHHEIDIEDYVRQVLYRLCFCQSVRIFWPDEYDFLKYRDEENQPMVLDPANPFVNVAPNMKDASRVSERAVEMFERYGTVKHRPLPPNQYAFPQIWLILRVLLRPCKDLLT
ncbi:2'-5'-oligoadenylate synthase 1A-like isoform X2 [Haliotis rubra]|uniref:2'-5'-oligoadenylate synthase 1A-like isoform X2 n=1 Tax=Haliotis rubra TaxID=36100 RepID=UPI001EE53831|nr:2'-5'-oligoadenylate synthase 1A-like isoform X2 [Haliotis rubra]